MADRVEILSVATDVSQVQVSPHDGLLVVDRLNNPFSIRTGNASPAVVVPLTVRQLVL